MISQQTHQIRIHNNPYDEYFLMHKKIGQKKWVYANKKFRSSNAAKQHIKKIFPNSTLVIERIDGIIKTND